MKSVPIAPSFKHTDMCHLNIACCWHTGNIVALPANSLANQAQLKDSLWARPAHSSALHTRWVTRPMIMLAGGGQLIQQVHDEGITPIAQSIKSKLLLQTTWVLQVCQGTTCSWNRPSTYYMVVRRHTKKLVLTLEYACRSSTEKLMICHAGLSFKQHALVDTVIMYQILSIWALLANSLDWRHADAAHICLLVTGVTNIALATVGVVCVTDILAQRPACFDMGMLCSQYVMQLALKAGDNGINWLRQLKDYILNIHWALALPWDMVDDYDVFFIFHVFTMWGLCTICGATRLYAVTCDQCWVHVWLKMMPYLVSFWATYCLPALASTVSQLQMWTIII